MEIYDVIKSKREEILKTASNYGAYNVRLFGSVARGESYAGSDVDFLVSIEDDRNFLDVVGLWQDLEEMLGCKVDVITDEGVSPYLRERIYSEAVLL